MSLVINSCLIFDESKSRAYGPTHSILVLSDEGLNLQQIAERLPFFALVMRVFFPLSNLIEYFRSFWNLHPG